MNNNQKVRNQLNLFMAPRVLLRGMGLYLLLAFLSLSLGIAFFLITIGFVQLVLWFAFYWEPAYRIFVKVLNVPTLNRDFVRIPITWWRLVPLSLKAGFILFCFYYAFRILATQGFLNQNIIYWLITN